MSQCLPGGDTFSCIPFFCQIGASRNSAVYGKILSLAFVLVASACLPGCAGHGPRSDSGPASYDWGVPGVTRLPGAKPGPVLFVIAGLHGDEPSGPAAARSLGSGSAPARGTIVILPEACPEALDNGSRCAPGWSDLNRAFPEGAYDPVARARLSDPSFARADAIFGLLASERPFLVLDLHESDESWTEGSTPSLVISSSTHASELALALLEAPGMEGFTFSGPPPSGSLAAAADVLLDIPAFIVEVPDYLEPAERVRLYLGTIAAALRLLGMSGPTASHGAEGWAPILGPSDAGGA